MRCATTALLFYTALISLLVAAQDIGSATVLCSRPIALRIFGSRAGPQGNNTANIRGLYAPASGTSANTVRNSIAVTD
ncbi:hypothetical protein BFJ66_g16015 [Fusarium oxysporum f. sp. cepae]|nr:hypothetical protein BFJ66_g16015 [Fusarium oxysporum f. sp. cepae]